MTWARPAKDPKSTPAPPAQCQGQVLGVFPTHQSQQPSCPEWGGVFTGLPTKQKGKKYFSMEGLQDPSCAKHHAAPLLLLLPQGVLHAITQLPIITRWLGSAQDGMTSTVKLSVWESISWSTGPFLEQAIYQIISTWNILALGSQFISSISNKVFPKAAGDHKDFQDFHLTKYTWPQQHFLCLCLFFPSTQPRKPTSGLRKMQITLQEHSNFPSKSSDRRVWMLLKHEVQVLH